MVELCTERLTVRPLTFDDAPFILRLLNEPSFIENIGDKGVRDLEGAGEYLREGPMASYGRLGFGLWRVGLPVDDTPIGMAGFLKRDYLDAIDLGYALLPEFWGRGYAYEVTSAVMNHAWSQLHATRVLAIVSRGNESSIGLLKKLGFEGDGTVRVPGTTEDVLRFVSTPSPELRAAR